VAIQLVTDVLATHKNHEWWNGLAGPVLFLLHKAVLQMASLYSSKCADTVGYSFALVQCFTDF
jgi:hypothetical protein